MATQMSFMASVQSFAKPFIKTAAAKQDPIAVARARFVAAAEVAAKEITEGKLKGFWFKKLDSGFVVTLKNGAKALENCAFAVATQKDAVKLLEAAKASCAKGEFDQQFTATARKARAPKVEDAAVAPSKK